MRLPAKKDVYPENSWLKENVTIVQLNVLFAQMLQHAINALMVHSFHQMLVLPHVQMELMLIMVNANHVMLHAKFAKMELPILVHLALAISY